MIVVIFEVESNQGRQQDYLDAAARMRELLQRSPGFISVERFASLTNPAKLLSLSFWQDEASVATWRAQQEHRDMQQAGRNGIFANYRIRVAAVLRDYGLKERAQVPEDSRKAHG